MNYLTLDTFCTIVHSKSNYNRKKLEHYIAESWSAAWRDREVKTILAGSPGVEGWEAVYRRSPATWPQLASDLSNVAIVRKQQRRGRH